MPPASLATPAEAPEKRATVRRRLLNWYDKSHRRLPWRISPDSRTTADPYRVLVSETMLQQTQVATVEPYFMRFVERWPTVSDLARASEQDVLAAWQGLGYYRRARQLHAAARAVVDSHRGTIPADAAQLLRLPGVGRYTAGAIASIAFGESEPIVDGNVARVLARFFSVEEPVDTPAGRDHLWSLADQLVPPPSRCSTTRRFNPPGDFNQALMELGALVCTPRRPRCNECPLRDDCAALMSDAVERLPIKRRNKSAVPVQHDVLVIERRGRHLFQQRPAQGLWSNMWQLPTRESPPDARGSQKRHSMHDLQQWIKHALGIDVDALTPLQAFEHRTTHRLIDFQVWKAQGPKGPLRRGVGVWRSLTQIEDLPVSNAQQRIIQRLLQQP